MVDKEAYKTQSHLAVGLIFLFVTIKISEASTQANPTKYKTIFNGLAPLVTKEKVKIENSKLEKNRIPAAQKGAKASKCDLFIARK